MNRVRRLIGVALFAAAGGVLIMGASGGCGSDLHKAAVATDAIANSLNEAAQLNHQLVAGAVLTAADGSVVAKDIEQAAEDNEVLTDQVQQAESSHGTLTAATIVAAFGKLNSDVQQLQTDGALHIKDAASVAKFKAITDAIAAEISTLQAIVGAQAASTRHSPLGGGGAALAALTLTAEEIEQLIALVTPLIGDGADLVKKLIGMKGETDAQLLSDATAENAGAVKQAEADEQPK